MFSVYLAANETLRDELHAFLTNRPDEAVVVGSADTLETAFKECARDNPGVLLLDARLAEADPHLVDALATTPYPIVLIAFGEIASATRLALHIRAKDLLTADTWRTELWSVLDRAAIPLYPRDKKLGRVISVFSSKGGVGKTTLAVNLGVGLAERAHEPVAIVDLDLSFGDVAPMLTLEPDLSVHDVMLSGIDPDVLKKAMVEYGPNVFVLAAPPAPEDAEDIAPPQLVKILELLREDYAFVVLDLAPGYQETNVMGLDVSDVILTLCTPDVVTLRTVGQALTLFRDELRYPPDKIRLIVNRTGSRTGIERSDVAAILKSPNIYELPSAGSMPVRHANQGKPFVTEEPTAPLSRAIMALADELTDDTLSSKASVHRRTLPRRHSR